jgi:hypothetical protein
LKNYQDKFFLALAVMTSLFYYRNRLKKIIVFSKKRRYNLCQKFNNTAKLMEENEMLWKLKEMENAYRI